LDYGKSVLDYESCVFDLWTKTLTKANEKEKIPSLYITLEAAISAYNMATLTDGEKEDRPP
jgi:hypothetical protein